jgi:hypothetical protein
LSFLKSLLIKNVFDRLKDNCYKRGEKSTPLYFELAKKLNGYFFVSFENALSNLNLIATIKHDVAPEFSHGGLGFSQRQRVLFELYRSATVSIMNMVDKLRSLLEMMLLSRYIKILAYPYRRSDSCR